MGRFTAFRDSYYPTRPFAGFPAAPGFALPVARALSWAAQVAYEVLTPAKCDTIFGNWGWQPRGGFNAAAAASPSVLTKGFVATVDGVTIIAFAGTEPEQWQDWREDFSVLRDNTDAHAGFQSGVDAVWTALQSAAQAAPGDIYLTGHSLGAALAAVTAERLVARNVVQAGRIRAVHTIGMPRIGDQAYTTRYNATGGGLLGQRTFRLVHGKDVVTKVPPVALGYAHVGQVLACPRGGPFAGTPQPTADPAPMAELLTLADALIDLPLFAEHDDLPPYPSPDPLVEAGVGMLPRGIRDHLADRYLNALG